MSEPGKAFVVHKGKKSGGSMRGPRKSAPPTPKVKPPKKATRFNAATNPSSDTQVYEGMEVIILYNETGTVGHEVKKKHRAIVLAKEGNSSLTTLTSADVKKGKRLAACGAEVWRVRFFDKEGNFVDEWFSPHGAEKKGDDDEWELPKNKKVKIEESGTEGGEVAQVGDDSMV